MSSNLSVTDCIRKYALPDQQDQAKLYSWYPYPGADGSEIRTALQCAALRCDEMAVEVLLRELRWGSGGNVETRLICIKETRKEIKAMASSDARFDGILQRLTKTKMLLKEGAGSSDSLPLPPRLMWGWEKKESGINNPGFWNRRNSQAMLRQALSGGCKKYVDYYDSDSE